VNFGSLVIANTTIAHTAKDPPTIAAVARRNDF
jgi:hypothetical protein